MTAFTAGEAVMVDRAQRATFIGYTANGSGAIIRMGFDTRVVDPVILSREEA